MEGLALDVGGGESAGYSIDLGWVGQYSALYRCDGSHSFLLDPKRQEDSDRKFLHFQPLLADL